MIGTLGHIDFVARRPQVDEYFKQARENIQVGGGSDVPLVRRKTEHKKRQPLLGNRDYLQPVPARKPPANSLTTLLDRFRLVTAFRQAAEYERLGRTVNFRNRHLHRALNRIQPQLAELPVLYRLNVQRNQRAERHFEFFHEIDGRFAVVHRGPANETESGKRNNLAHARLSCFAVALVFNKEPAARIAIVHESRDRWDDAEPFRFDRSDQPIVMTPRIAYYLRAHQQESDCRACIKRASPLCLPFAIRVEAIEQLWRIGMIDTDGRH